MHYTFRVDWVSTEYSYHGEVPVEEMKRIRIKDDPVTSVENQVSTAASPPDAFRTSSLNTKQVAAEDQDKGARNEALDSLIDMDRLSPQ
jgi:hypothetical protein